MEWAGGGCWKERRESGLERRAGEGEIEWARKGRRKAERKKRKKEEGRKDRVGGGRDRNKF